MNSAPRRKETGFRDPKALIEVLWMLRAPHPMRQRVQPGRCRSFAHGGKGSAAAGSKDVPLEPKIQVQNNFHAL